MFILLKDIAFQYITIAIQIGMFSNWDAMSHTIAHNVTQGHSPARLSLSV